MGEPRYDYLFVYLFVYLRSSPLSESDESEPSGGAQSHPTRHCTWLQPEAHHAHKNLDGYIFHKHLVIIQNMYMNIEAHLNTWIVHRIFLHIGWCVLSAY